MDTTKTGFCQAVEEFSRKKKIFTAEAGCSIQAARFLHCNLQRMAHIVIHSLKYLQNMV